MICLLVNKESYTIKVETRGLKYCDHSSVGFSLIQLREFPGGLWLICSSSSRKPTLSNIFYLFVFLILLENRSHESFLGKHLVALKLKTAVSRLQWWTPRCLHTYSQRYYACKYWMGKAGGHLRLRQIRQRGCEADVVTRLQITPCKMRH